MRVTRVSDAFSVELYAGLYRRSGSGNWKDFSETHIRTVPLKGNVTLARIFFSSKLIYLRQAKSRGYGESS